MPLGGRITPPPGWREFVRRYPKLDPLGHRVTHVTLSHTRAEQLSLVQREVNRNVTLVEDRRDRWNPAYFTGDCEDIAIRKLKTLTEDYGWPRGALMLAVCFTEEGRGHAVLLAETDQGVFTLDNRFVGVRPWQELPYLWLAREEPGDAERQWRRIQSRSFSEMKASTRRFNSASR